MKMQMKRTTASRELTIYDKDIIKFLKAVARRKFFQNYLNNMSKITCIGIFLAFILNFLSLFVPIYNADIYGYYIIAASFIISLLYSLIKYPSLYDAAIYADAAGLKEKLVTSLEFMGTQGGFVKLLKEDTLSEIEAFDKKLRLPIKYPFKMYIAACLFLSMFAICVFLPAQSKLDAEKLHNLAMQAKEVKEKVEEADKALNKAMKDEETKADAEKIKEVLEQAKKELGEAKDSHDIKKAEERLAKKLKEELAKAAGENESNAFNSDSSKKLINAMQPLVPEFDLTQFAKYHEKLAELAKESGLSENALNELKSLGDMLTKEQMEKLLENLENSMKDGEISNDELKEALDATDSADAQMAAASITQQASNSSSNETSQSSGGSGGAQVSAESSNGSQSESEGENSSGSGGSGSGSGENAGTGGNGNGMGSNGGNGSGSGGMGGGWNMGSDKGLEREATEGKSESVFVTGMEMGNDDNLTGKKSGEAKMTKKSNQAGNAMAGSKAALDSVVGDYSSQAYAKVNSGQVPASMKDVVKNYFSGLSN